MYFIPSSVAAALAATSIALLQSPEIAQTKDAEPASRAVNDSFLKALPSNDRADFDDANRGFMATVPDGTIPGPGGKPAWDNNQYDFLKNEQSSTDGESKLMAAGAAQRHQRPLQSDRSCLSGAWPRYL